MARGHGAAGVELWSRGAGNYWLEVMEGHRNSGWLNGGGLEVVIGGYGRGGCWVMGVTGG